MAIPLLYSTGSITVAANGTTVTGTGTAWASVVRRGSILQAGTSFAIVTSDPDIPADLPTNTSFKIARPWTVGALTSQPYQLVVYQGGAEFAEMFIDLVQRLGSSGTMRVAAVAPAAADGANNDLWLNTVTSVLSYKTSGAWVTLPYITGGVVKLQTASYTLTLPDQNDIISMNVTAAPSVVTIPTDAAVPFPIGTFIDVLQQSTISVTIVGAAGVTLFAQAGSVGASGAVTTGQGSRVRLYKLTAANWLASGDVVEKAIISRTVSTSLALTDLGDLVQINAAATISVTVPTAASIAWPIGGSVDVMQYGAGPVVIVAAAGVTINTQAAAILQLANRYSVASLTKIATDEWVLTGDLVDQAVNVQTASYTLLISDQNDLVEMNVATANTLTVPAAATVAFPIGTFVDVIQYGVGATTITPAAGVTIRSNGGLLQPVAQYTQVRLTKIALNEWLLSGKYIDGAVVAKTASYTLALLDQSNIIEMNVATANNLTVPANATIPFPVAAYVDIIQYGAGVTTLVPAAGVTIRSEGGQLKTNGQYAMVRLTKIAPDEWVLAGNRAT